jgi:hypothetical protein
MCFLFQISYLLSVNRKVRRCSLVFVHRIGRCKKNELRKREKNDS